MTEVLTVLCTCPNSIEAAKLAAGLVESELAACVNILPEIRSIYRWQGDLHNDEEVLMIAKTTRQAYSRVEKWLIEHHPYDVPEILAIPVQAGSSSYLEWVKSECQEKY
jgi:periplasmic divalent cation tolerance protein